MLPFAIDAIDHQHVLDTAEMMSEAVNDKYPVQDRRTNITNAIAAAVVCVGWLQAIAEALNVDETELFEGIAEAIDDGALPNFR